MAKSREIKRRIKAVANIKRITKTMQMIATARFQAAQRRAMASKPYSRKIAELVAELAQATLAEKGAGATHPLLAVGRPVVNRELMLVITSNRGLCGGYNANVLRTATAHMRERKGVTIDLEVAGKKGQAFFKFAGQPVVEFHGGFGDNPSYDQVKKLAEKYMGAFAAGKYDSVSVAYMSFISMSRQTPRVLKLLPLEKPAVEAQPPSAVQGGAGGTGGTGGTGPAKAAPRVQYDFTPDAESLLNELLPITVESQLFQCFNEAVVSEQIARMVAMKSATDSAGKMGKELSRRYNRARQAAITTELSEIIAGAAGLE